MSVTFKDNSKSVLSAMQQAKSAALIQIGIEAKRNIQGVIIEKDIVDTYQLHDTIDYGSDGIIGKVPTDAVDVGSPKDYGQYQELGTSRIVARPFIRPGILDHIDEYKNIVSDVVSGKMK